MYCFVYSCKGDADGEHAREPDLYPEGLVPEPYYFERAGTPACRSVSLFRASRAFELLLTQANSVRTRVPVR
jgi:hypothetical protein